MKVKLNTTSAFVIEKFGVETGKIYTVVNSRFSDEAKMTGYLINGSKGSVVVYQNEITVIKP